MNSLWAHSHSRTEYPGHGVQHVSNECLAYKHKLHRSQASTVATGASKRQTKQTFFLQPRERRAACAFQIQHHHLDFFHFLFHPSFNLHNLAPPFPLLPGYPQLTKTTVEQDLTRMNSTGTRNSTNLLFGQKESAWVGSTTYSYFTYYTTFFLFNNDDERRMNTSTLMNGCPNKLPCNHHLDTTGICFRRGRA